MSTVRIVRTAGAFEEALDGVGVTLRNTAFDCPISLADRLLAEPERFERAPSPQAGDTVPVVEAVSEPAEPEPELAESGIIQE